MIHRFSVRFWLSAMAVCLFIFAAGASISSASADKEKMKPEELIAKHLESIGAAESRDAAGGRVINGTAVATFRVGGHGQTEGKAIMASSGPMNMIGMAFGLVDYPQKKSDLRITLFFDPETFRHVRTQYYQVIEPAVGESKPGESAGQDPTRIQIVEEFSDFKAENKLTLPHTYKMRLDVQGPGKALMYDWVLTLTSFEFGQALEAKNFNMEVN